MVLTRDAELHLLDRACVAVRDRRSGVWQAEHAALGTTLRGCLAPGDQTLSPGAVRLGATLLLEADDQVQEAGEVLATEQLRPDESARLLERIRAELVGTQPGRRAGRWARLLLHSGLLPWLSPGQREP